MLSLKFSDELFEAGTDEAGRGCLAGPVTAAAVILPDDFRCEELTDSKQLNRRQRIHLRQLIEQYAICYHVEHISCVVIDEINILNASILGMQQCIEKLSVTPLYIIVDGNRFKPVRNIPHSCIVKGDSLYLSIAAASVLAKTYRDDYMAELHELHPEYDWRQNKGYPTQAHRQALSQFGPTPHHRRSFRLLPDQLELFSESFDGPGLHIGLEQNAKMM